jgi:hypothetical protein
MSKKLSVLLLAILFAQTAPVFANDHSLRPSIHAEWDVTNSHGLVEVNLLWVDGSLARYVRLSLSAFDSYCCDCCGTGICEDVEYDCVELTTTDPWVACEFETSSVDPNNDLDCNVSEDDWVFVTVDDCGATDDDCSDDCVRHSVLEAQLERP